MSFDELLQRHDANGRSVSTTRAAGKAAPPALHATVVTCMDARIDPAALFGAEAGEVHVLRNAGGVVTDDVLRSLAISQRKLGTRDVLLVQHTGCGMSTFTDDDFVEELARDCGERPGWRPHTFADPAENVRHDMAELQHSPFLVPETRVRGFVLDIESFALEEVTADATVAD